MRSKKAILNIIFSLLLQFVTIICGFIIPRLTITHYGSEINGLITSITQFLSYIVLLEAGIGGVVRAALYKPLSHNKTKEISEILVASNSFFKKIALIFLVYIAIMVVFYPFVVIDNFQYLFTMTLIIAIGISTFAQYYFGITFQLLLHADQKQYITSIIQIITLIINLIIVVILIKFDSSIILIKIASSLVLILRPLIVNLYVRKKYNIDLKINSNKNFLAQKWDGFAHHIAFFLHTNTDVVVLTLFTTIKEVSVYSVYNLIVTGVRSGVSIFSTGLEATFGNMIAQKEKENLKRKFDMVDVFTTLITTIFFITAYILIEPFITLYTKGVTDINYHRYWLGLFLILAEAVFCIRQPYNSLVIGAGHFKETKWSAYIEAGINIIFSIIFVNIWGINGVAFATLIAMFYRTIYYFYYLD